MKRIFFMFTAIIMFAGISIVHSQTQFQAKVSTTATAEIVSAISLTSDAQLNFGKMSSPNAAVDVILSTSKAVTTTNASAISVFPAQAANAHYTVTGATGYNYAITFPQNDVVSISTGSNSMFVNDFKALVASKPGSDGTTGTLTSGSDTFVVGATLKVKLDQAPGTYTGSYDVLVSYN